MEGNLVQKISNGNIYHMLNETLTGFVVTNVENKCEDSGSAGYSGNFNYCASSNNETYYLNYNIKTEVTGKGNIEVINTSKNGASVTFVVTPEEGYVLGTVKVTDKNGNVVTFTDNTFTMPSADVTIEVTFTKIPEKENPETSDLAVIACIAIIIIGSWATIRNIRKLMWLK